MPSAGTPVDAAEEKVAELSRSYLTWKKSIVINPEGRRVPWPDGCASSRISLGASPWPCAEISRLHAGRVGAFVRTWGRSQLPDSPSTKLCHPPKDCTRFLRYPSHPGTIYKWGHKPCPRRMMEGTFKSRMSEKTMAAPFSLHGS